MKKLSTACLAVLISVTGMAWAGDETVTDCRTIIDQPGHYSVANDILDCPEGGVTIVSSDVVLDLKRHEISCINNGEFIGGVVVLGTPDTPVRNVTVKNGYVSNCADGIVLQDAEGCLVTGMTSYGNWVYKGGSEGTGLTLFRASKNTIRNNLFYGNELFGLYSVESAGNRYFYNVLLDNGDAGIFAFVETGSRFQGNWSHGNTDGIALGPFSTDNLIRGNLTTYNEKDGIGMWGYWYGGVYEGMEIPSGNTIRLNKSFGNKEVGDLSEAYFDFASGGALEDPDLICRNTWEKNMFRSSFGPDDCFGRLGKSRWFKKKR